MKTTKYKKVTMNIPCNTNLFFKSSVSYKEQCFVFLPLTGFCTTAVSSSLTRFYWLFYLPIELLMVVGIKELEAGYT
jgi:hypothetical protein